MAKYIVQHRRGTASQWAAKDTIIPKSGEIVIEIDEENSLHKLKIGDGIHTYAELAYLMAGDEIVTQVLSQALPRVVTITLDVNEWSEITCESDPNLGYYGQTVNLDNITKYSRLDLQPDADTLAEFQNLNLVFSTENKNGIITVYSVGDMPLKSYTMQATIVETEPVTNNDKVVGIPIGTPTTKSDWAQEDESKADYIKNKPVVLTEEDVLELIGSGGGGSINQVQSDWNQTDDTQPDYIKNKPDINTLETNVNNSVKKSDVLDIIDDNNYENPDKPVNTHAVIDYVTGELSNFVDRLEFDRIFADGEISADDIYYKKNSSLEEESVTMAEKLDILSEEIDGVNITLESCATEDFVQNAVQDVVGIYMGSGEMPDNCWVQIDPNGDALTLDGYFGDLKAALDRLIAIENELIGGGNV